MNEYKINVLANNFQLIKNYVIWIRKVFTNLQKSFITEVIYNLQNNLNILLLN